MHELITTNSAIDPLVTCQSGICCKQTIVSHLVVKLHSLYRCRLVLRIPYACSPAIDGGVLIEAGRECIVVFGSVSVPRPILGVGAPSVLFLRVMLHTILLDKSMQLLCILPLGILCLSPTRMVFVKIILASITIFNTYLNNQRHNKETNTIPLNVHHSETTLPRETRRTLVQLRKTNVPSHIYI